MKQFYRGQPVVDKATGDKYFYFDTVCGVEQLHARVYDECRKLLIALPLSDIDVQQHPIDRRVDFIKAALWDLDKGTLVDTVGEVVAEKLRVVLSSDIDEFLDFLEDVTARIKRDNFLYFSYEVDAEGLDSVVVQLEFYYEAK